MKTCLDCAKEFDDEGIFCPFWKKYTQGDVAPAAGRGAISVDATNAGYLLTIAAGIGLILGALLPWAHLINDGEEWIYGLDGVGKYTALIALALFATAVYRVRSANRAAGATTIILGVLATVIGISKLANPDSIVARYSHAEFTVEYGLYLTVIAGLIGVIGGLVNALPPPSGGG